MCGIGAIENPDTEQPFDVCDALRESWLGDAEFFCGAAEMTASGQCPYQFQMSIVSMKLLRYRLDNLWLLDKYIVITYNFTQMQ